MPKQVQFSSFYRLLGQTVPVKSLRKIAVLGIGPDPFSSTLNWAGLCLIALFVSNLFSKVS